MDKIVIIGGVAAGATSAAKVRRFSSIAQITMIEAIKKLFGLKTTDYNQLIKESDMILDVRNPGEFSTGHIKGAINIPLNKLSDNLNKLKAKNKKIILRT
jgi:predicted sulfurtransferase